MRSRITPPNVSQPYGYIEVHDRQERNAVWEQENRGRVEIVRFLRPQ